jgi:chemotaxis response regulator CheB
MQIGVLLADDSEIMRNAIADILRADPEIQLLAQASSFIQTMELTSTLRPQVVVMDLYMRDEKNVTPFQVKSCLRGSVLLSISLRNDDESKALAESFGAVALVEKVNLADELIPVKNCTPRTALKSNASGLESPARDRSERLEPFTPE